MVVDHPIPRLIEDAERFLAFHFRADFARHMIRGGFLGEEDRTKLIVLARDGATASRVTRRANALVLLDDGWSCQQVAHAFLLDDDTSAAGGSSSISSRPIARI